MLGWTGTPGRRHTKVAKLPSACAAALGFHCGSRAMELRATSTAAPGNNHPVVLRAWCRAPAARLPSRGAPWVGRAIRPLAAAWSRVSSPVTLSCARRADAGPASPCFALVGLVSSRRIHVGSGTVRVPVGQYVGTRLATALAPLPHPLPSCSRLLAGGCRWVHSPHLPSRIRFWTCAVAVRGAVGILPPTFCRMGLVWFTRGCIIGPTTGV